MFGSFIYNLFGVDLKKDNKIILKLIGEMIENSQQDEQVELFKLKKNLE